MNRWSTNRITLSLILSTLLCGVAVARRENNHVGLSDGQFWATKLSWRESADIVACGDSRVLNAFSPSSAEAIMPDARVLNYAFSSAGYSPEYLAAIDGIVDPRSDQKTIVLGITPHSLTPEASTRNTFIEESNRSATRLAQGSIIDRAMFYLRPMNTKEFRRLFRSSRQSHKYTELSHNGWRAVSTHRIDRANVLEYYQSKLFDHNAVDWAIADSLCQAVSKWTRNSVVVYAFRPPTCPEMEAIENKHSGFIETLFVEKFTQAGGIWIELDDSDLTCYDGSHIDRQSAEILTHRLSSKIACGRDTLSDRPRARQRQSSTSVRKQVATRPARTRH